MRGEALTTQRLLVTLELLTELVQGHLNGRDLSPEQLSQELRSAQAGDLGGLPLGDQALGVPMAGRGEPHLDGELGRCLPQGREDRRGEIKDDLRHGRLLLCQNPNLVPPSSGLLNPRHTCFLSIQRSPKRDPYPTFTADCCPFPGTVRNRTGLRGFRLAPRCQFAISSNDQVPDWLVTAK